MEEIKKELEDYVIFLLKEANEKEMIPTKELADIINVYVNLCNSR